MSLRLSPLPIDSQLSEIAEAVRVSRNVILTATPGAGKTTRLPPELLKSVSGKIAVLEPRRMATVAACNRVCEEQGWSVGQEAGYQVRFESRTSAKTRLLFMTDALLLRRLNEDPELREFDLIVIDEFHERNLNQDLILGCVKELQELGSSIKLLIMSATLDTDRLVRFLPESVHMDVPGLVFPLETRYSDQPLRLQTDFAFYDRVVQATARATRETDGDVLVFLPGTGEIARVSDRLFTAGVKRPIVPLHGSLPLAEQNEALRAPREPRVVLATNVAEASVTVQGVDFVIDTGLAKVMDMNLSSGFSALKLSRISLFNARQRAGRAARQKAGVCLRLWTPHEEVTQAEQMTPECARVDLSSSLLLLAHLGVSDFMGFAWFDPPPPRLVGMAVKTLRSIGALDAQSRLTEFGRHLMRYPLPPRLGATVYRADEMKIGRVGAWIAAILNERDFVDRETTTNTECDIVYRLSLLRELDETGRVSGANPRAARQILDSARQLEKMCRSAGGWPRDLEADVRRLLLLSQTEFLCRRRGSGERAVMAGGRGVKLAPNSQVKTSEFFVALQGLDLPGQPETLVPMACGVDKALLLDVLRDHVKTVEDVEFVEEKAAFFARRMRTILGLSLEDPVLTPVDPARVADRMAEILLEKWSWLTEQNESLGRWWTRWNFLLKHSPAHAEHLGREQILRTLEMAAFGKTKLAEVLAQDLSGFLQSTLPADVVRVFQREVPEKFTAPTGFEHRIHYEEHGAYVEVRLQEMFGLQTTPRLALGLVPLTFRLLSPAYRPVQVTSDIAGFWRGAYLEVRKELRSRYPKHSWPDDPLSAKPEAKGRRRS